MAVEDCVYYVQEKKERMQRALRRNDINTCNKFALPSFLKTHPNGLVRWRNLEEDRCTATTATCGSRRSFPSIKL